MKRGYALGAFNVNNMEIAQGILAGAARVKAPVILQISNGAREYAGTEYLVKIVAAAAKEYRHIPIILHQDHGPDYETCTSAIDAGFTSVMIDGSALPYEENIALTKKVVRYAHRRRVWVEAELGQLVGEQFDTGEGGAESRGMYTDPDKAKEFILRTNCDALAVAIGTSHGAYKFMGEPHIDLERLERIKKVVGHFPLVLHGASSVPSHYVDLCNRYGGKLAGARGVSEDIIVQAIKWGVVKVNTDTDLRLAMTGAIRRVFGESPDIVDPRTYLGAARVEIAKLVEQKLRLFGSAGKV